MSPYKDDEIYAEMNPSLEIEDTTLERDEEEEEIKNVQLKEVLEFYDCYDLLHYANHLIWLHTVKEAIGYIPFSLGYEDICCLVVLSEEISKKATMESQRMAEKSRSVESSATPLLSKSRSR